MSSFSANLSTDDRGALLKLEGSLDYDSVTEFERVSDEIVAAKPKRAVIDAAGLTYLNSAGIGVLMKLNRRLQESQCELRLAAVKPEVCQMLKVCFLDRVLKIAGSVDEAFRA